MVIGTAALGFSTIFSEGLRNAAQQAGTTSGTELGSAISFVFGGLSIALMLYGLIAPEHEILLSDRSIVVRQRVFLRSELQIPFDEIQAMRFVLEESYDGDFSRRFTIALRTGNDAFSKTYPIATAKMLEEGLRRHAPELRIDASTPHRAAAY